MDGSGITVRLGERDYRIYEQRIGRIQRKLGAVASLVQASGGEATEITEQLHEGLVVFIPDLAPMWELAGWPDRDSYEKRRSYDRKLSEGRDEWARDKYDRPYAELTPTMQGELDDPEPPDDPRSDETDRSPRPSEIMDAIETIFQVHGGPRLLKIARPLVDPTALRAWVSEWLLNQTAAQAVSRRSQTSPPQNGASASPSSTTSAPTPSEPASEESRPLGF